MVKQPILAPAAQCTGCGACRNACAKEAILMQPDGEGFLYPHIVADRCVGCGSCEKSCPVLQPQYSNFAHPNCYAMMANDEERAKSSSGAFVPVIANWVLAQGGVVYGAAWAEDWSVRHIGVEDTEELLKIRSSKYLQSDAGLTYREARRNLQAGRWVLYTGTPCEIAGLKGYLGGNVSTQKLLTIDILCHGTPPYKAFRKYLEDSYDVSKIVRIDFRDKSVFNWSTCMNLYFNDQTEAHVTEKNDPYYRAFLPCMIMRPSCATCPFSRLPRQGDFTAGDFWGLRRYKPSLNDKKGTSVVLVNNAKAKKLINQLLPQLKLWEKAPLSAATYVNKTILHPFRQHPGRKHFFSAFGLKPFQQLVENSLEHHYDIGIVGLWYGINYGSVLTYFALYTLLRDLGYDPVMLPRPNMLWRNDAQRFDAPDSIAQKFVWNHCNVFQSCRYQEEYLRFNDLCSSFVVGSDVVWSYKICGKDTDQFFFMDWVETGHKKIAFASSFGNGLTGPQAYQEKAQYYLNRFDAISIRESYGVAVAKEQCGREDVAHVLDPVFLCDPEIYNKLMDEAENPPVSKLFVYMLRRQYVKERTEIIGMACKHYGVEQATICGNPNAAGGMREFYPTALEQTLSIEEWLVCMKRAECYIGDSYHGLCFALIFHVPFLIVYGPNVVGGSEQRFVSLLELVGLSDRMLRDLNDTQKVEQLLNQPIDWDDVERRLQVLRSFSRQWLEDALKKPALPSKPDQFIQETQRRAVYETLIRLQETVDSIPNPRSNARVKRWGRYLKQNGVWASIRKAGSKVRQKLRAEQ